MGLFFFWKDGWWFYTVQLGWIGTVSRTLSWMVLGQSCHRDISTIFRSWKWSSSHMLWRSEWIPGVAVTLGIGLPICWLMLLAWCPSCICVTMAPARSCLASPTTGPGLCVGRWLLQVTHMPCDRSWRWQEMVQFIFTFSHFMFSFSSCLADWQFMVISGYHQRQRRQHPIDFFISSHNCRSSVP